MKPVTSALPAANWMMRISVFLFVLFTCLNQIKVVNFTKAADVIVFAYVLAAALLVLGGFINSDTLTIIAGALVFLLAIYFVVAEIFIRATLNIELASLPALMILLWPASVGLYFMASGNS